MKTRDLTFTAIFISIILLFSFTPLGFIHLGVIKATLVHIPVIIGALILGPRIGALLGLCFGLISMVINTFTPSALSFAFSPFVPVIGTNQTSWWAILIALVPRILVGIIPYYVYQMLLKKNNTSVKHQQMSLFVAGISGSLVNTLLVMNLIYFLFQDAYSAVKGVEIGVGLYKAVLSVILINGVPEALVAGIATSAVTIPLLKIYSRNRS